MRRRESILGIISIGVAGILGYSGHRWYQRHRPDLSELREFKTLIDNLAGVIIPETVTPGASQANVSDFIISMIEDCTPSI